MPCLHVPLSTLRTQPRGWLRMTRGQDGSLDLSCVTLSFTTPRRFIPAHPPSTSSPCPAWSCPLRSPFFRRGETAVQKRLAPLQWLLLIEFGQKRPPDSEPDPLLFPIPQPPPAGRWRGKLLGQILPPSPAAQHPPNAFQHFAVRSRRPNPARPRRSLGKQGPDLFPLGLGQQPTVSRHPPSFWR